MPPKLRTTWPFPFCLKEWKLAHKHRNIYTAAAVQEALHPGLAENKLWKEFLDRRGRYRYGFSRSDCERCPNGCYWSPEASIVLQLEFTLNPSRRIVDKPKCIACQEVNRPCSADTPCTVEREEELASKDIYVSRLHQDELIPRTPAAQPRQRPLKCFFDVDTRNADNAPSSALHRLQDFTDALLRIDEYGEAPVQDLAVMLAQARFRIPHSHSTPEGLTTLHTPELRRLVYALASSPAAPLAIQRTLMLWRRYLVKESVLAIHVDPDRRKQLEKQVQQTHAKLHNSFVEVDGGQVRFDRATEPSAESEAETSEAEASEAHTEAEAESERERDAEPWTDASASTAAADIEFDFAQYLAQPLDTSSDDWLSHLSVEVDPRVLQKRPMQAMPRSDFAALTPEDQRRAVATSATPAPKRMRPLLSAGRANP